MFEIKMFLLFLLLWCISGIIEFYSILSYRYYKTPKNIEKWKLRYIAINNIIFNGLNIILFIKISIFVYRIIKFIWI